MLTVFVTQTIASKLQDKVLAYWSLSLKTVLGSTVYFTSDSSFLLNSMATVTLIVRDFAFLVKVNGQYFGKCHCPSDEVPCVALMA